ncbi:AraC family transcriptional regulator [Emcibacter nanhaiensis]|uniref:AraC family transcriptional regulator n=1 Tax=Emcibacter nanhaiensis TaxID=1505037 RepID=A0A501PGV9_9PROT|nr:AraC family transcriptional regulator [Emcibacter nanhaiensis]TPD59272.1 AraC family transcriptional regulator [Emcibacter nanhaiensis]
MYNISIPVESVHTVLKHARNRDIDIAALLRKNHISPLLLKEEKARVSAECFTGLQASTMLAMEDEMLGYLPRRQPVGTWKTLCQHTISCSTLGHALSRYCRFLGLFEWGLKPTLEISKDLASFRLVQWDDTEEIDPYAHELLLTCMHRYTSWLIQEHIPLKNVSLAYPSPGHAQEYRPLFFNAPVTFNHPHTELTFHIDFLAKPILQNDTALSRFLRHPLLIMLVKEYDKIGWTPRVREIIRKNLTEAIEMDDVATILNTHPQTLRRRLAKEGTSYKEIKIHLRRDVALYYLGKHNLSIEDIAFRAGFSEASSFIRAFKGWTGTTPYSYRKGL